MTRRYHRGFSDLRAGLSGGWGPYTGLAALLRTLRLVRDWDVSARFQIGDNGTAVGVSDKAAWQGYPIRWRGGG